MKILLTPSKTMDYDTPPPVYVRASVPQFIDEAKVIAKTIKMRSESQLAQLMGLSSALAMSVHAKYQVWDMTAKKPALWAYKGDVYKGMKANELSSDAGAWANEHFFIMSGLYGVLRPTDEIAPYRLEMKAKLEIGDTKDLYKYWGDRLGKFIEEQADGLIINLCSDEYSRVALRHVSKNTRVITPVFFDTKPNGKIGTVPIYSKMMRGVMARWMIDKRIERARELTAFIGHNYAYSETLSRPNAPAFYRKIMKPLVF